MKKELDLIRPKVLIATGWGFNSHEELGYCFNLAGADTDFIHLSKILEKPKILDKYNGLGLPGGFSGGDHLGAGQFVANMINQSPKGRSKLEEKVNDENFPIIEVCNSAQISSKLGLYPVEVGTVQNDVGKHQTQYWDLSIDKDCSSVWLNELRKTTEPIFAPISHGEGRFHLTEEGLAKAKEIGMIALRYSSNGAMSEYFKHVRNGVYNPNGSVDDIAGFSWKNNLALFPHFERLHKNSQRPDKYEAKERGVNLHANYEPTVLLFKGAVDYMKTQMRR